jgi:hypothetical protein
MNMTAVVRIGIGLIDQLNNCAEDSESLYGHTMGMEQMMECLVAEIRANQTKNKPI